MVRVKDIPSSERPREKLVKFGASSLSDSELLAIILKSGSKSCNVFDLAYELLNKYGSLYNLSQISLSELCSFKGIGEVKALELLTCFEIGKRMKRSIVKISNSNDIYEYFYSTLSFALQEELHCLFLDFKNQIIVSKLIFKGTVNSSTVHPRDILREAVRNNALGVVLVHNHPSGNPNPSENDRVFTKKIKLDALSLGINVIDHVIVGYNKYYSFNDQGW